MNLRAILFRLLILLALPLSVGCNTVRTVDDPWVNEDGFAARPPRTIALAPFTNMSGEENAGEKLREALYGALATMDYEDIELSVVGDFVDRAAMEYNIVPEKVGPEHIIHPDLADAIVFAEVERVSRLFILFFSQHRIEVNLSMYDTLTRQRLYLNRFTVRCRRYNSPTGIGGILSAFFSLLWQFSEEELDRSIESTAEEIRARFPRPYEGSREGGMEIVKVGVETPPSKMLRVGDRVLIRVEGSPRGKATYTIGNLVSDANLAETAPGQYSGIYEIQPGDNANYVFIEVKLVDREGSGQSVNHSAQDQAFAVDTIPPVPYAVHTWKQVPGTDGIYLQYGPENRTDPEAENVPSRYMIFRGTGDEEALTYLGDSETVEYFDPTALVGVQYQYSVVAVDQAGNEGEVLTRVKVKPRG